MTSLQQITFAGSGFASIFNITEVVSVIATTTNKLLLY